MIKATQEGDERKIIFQVQTRVLFMYKDYIVWYIYIQSAYADQQILYTDQSIWYMCIQLSEVCEESQKLYS